ncbi:MAG: hypothetical protein LBE35_02610, partial [Clostridiales bacterium]|nr:hypothetical protein [Clostridiales bacterium]
GRPRAVAPTYAVSLPANTPSFPRKRESPTISGGFRVKRGMTETLANLLAKHKPKAGARTTSFPRKRESPANSGGCRVKPAMT